MHKTRKKNTCVLINVEKTPASRESEHYQELLAWWSYSESPQVKAGKRSSWTMGGVWIQVDNSFVFPTLFDGSRQAESLASAV